MGERESNGPEEAPKVPDEANGREDPPETPAAQPHAAAGGETEAGHGDLGDVPTEEIESEGLRNGDEELSVEETAEELRRRLGSRELHLRELYDEVAGLRLAVDEARARMEATEARARQLEGERDRLAGRVRELEDEERRRGRRREGQERHIARLGREIERRDAEISRLEDLLEARRGEIETRTGKAGEQLSRKEATLQEALRRVAGLERDLEEREAEAVEQRAAAGKLRAELDLEYELRRRMSEPANRLRSGIDLFNSSEGPRTVQSISRSMGQPEVLVTLGDDENEPPAILTFTWQGITWQTYHANPGLAVVEPRVYLAASGEDLSGVSHKPPNARLGPGGKVSLGL